MSLFIRFSCKTKLSGAELWFNLGKTGMYRRFDSFYCFMDLIEIYSNKEFLCDLLLKRRNHLINPASRQ